MEPGCIRDLIALDNGMFGLVEVRSVPELERRLLECAIASIPTDVHAGLFLVDPLPQVTLLCSAGRPVGPEWMDLWNRRFSRCFPASFDPGGSVQVIDWGAEKSSAYSREFMLPQGIGTSLYVAVDDGIPGPPRMLVINRENGRRFSARELVVATRLHRFLPGLFRFANRLQESERSVVWRGVLASRGESLSNREMEVVQLLWRHLSVPEIGRRMRLSPRTVETYVDRAYAKLGVFDRRGLVRRVEAIAGGRIRRSGTATGVPEPPRVSVRVPR